MLHLVGSSILPYLIDDARSNKNQVYASVILDIVVCGCEPWSGPLREEQRLRVFENRVLREIFGPNSEEVTGDWRKLHNEERHGLDLGRYLSADQIKENVRNKLSRYF